MPNDAAAVAGIWSIPFGPGVAVCKAAAKLATAGVRIAEGEDIADRPVDVTDADDEGPEAETLDAMREEGS